MGDYSPKLTWESFEYDILDNIAVPIDEKYQMMIDVTVPLLERGSGIDQAIQSVPEKTKKVIPHLLHRIFIEKDHTVMSLGLDRNASKRLADVKERAEAKSEPQSFRIQFLAEMVLEHAQHPDIVEQWATKYDEAMQSLLDVSPSESTIAQCVATTFEEISTDSAVTIDAEKMCFLCGQEATKRYSKGTDAVYTTKGYSKRTEPQSVEKRICDACDIEYSLIENRVETQENVYMGEGMRMLYLHPSKFTAYVSSEAKSPEYNISNGDLTIDSPVAPEIFETQVQIIPIQVESGGASKEQKHLSNIYEILQYLHQTGQRATLDESYNVHTPSSHIFEDRNPTRLQQELGLDIIEDRSELRRAIHLFEVLDIGFAVDGVSEPYLQLESDSLLELAHLQYGTYNNDGIAPRIDEYIESYHDAALQSLEELGQAGVDLHGEKYGTRYKKSKVFRQALNTILDGLGRGKSESEITDMTTEQVYQYAQREKNAGRVTEEMAREYTDVVIEHLKDTGYYAVEPLTKQIEVQISAYIYSIDRVQNVTSSPTSSTTQTTS
jgi:CRISPR-associated protein Csc3